MRNRAALLGVAVVVAVVVAVASPASAKGITEGYIVGGGLSAPIHIDFTAPQGVQPGPDRFGLNGHYSAQQFSDSAPTSALGPRVTVVWMPYHQPDPIVQTLFPYAAGGPLVRTGSGQTFYDSEVPDGWFQADDQLLTELQAMGLPDRSDLVDTGIDPSMADTDAAADAGKSSSRSASSTPSRSDDDSTVRSWWVRGGFAAALAMIVGGALSLRARLRRRTLLT